MEDLFSLLIFAFFLWSMLGGLFGKKKEAPPQQRRPGRGQHPVPDDRAADPEPAPSPRPAARHGEEESAADMVPDDLWAILTGETRKPAPRPAPRPAPEPEPRWEPESGWEAEPAARDEPETEPWWEPEPEPEWEPVGHAGWDDDEEGEEGATVVTARSHEETLARQLPDPRETTSISVNRPSPVSEIGREGVGVLRERAAVRRMRQRRGPTPGRQRSLRRAMVLREVLGPPKGLE